MQISLRKQAKKERDYPAEFPRPFSILGNRSIFTADLPVFKITDQALGVIANLNKTFFTRLYDRLQLCGDDAARRATRLQDAYFMPLNERRMRRIEYGGKAGERSTTIDLSRGGYNIVEDAAEYLSRYRLNQGVGVEIEDVGYIPKVGFRFQLPYHRFPRSSNEYRNSESVYSQLHASDFKAVPQNIVDQFKHARTSEEREQLVVDSQQHLLYRFMRTHIEDELKARSLETRSHFDFVTQTVLDRLPEEQFPGVAEQLQNLKRRCEQGDGLAVCRDLMLLMNEHVQLKKVTPDSCFTWSREMLKLVGVEMSYKAIENLVSPTKLYLQRADGSPGCTVM